MKDTFDRDRVGVDRESQNAGLDILLNLAEKYPGIPNAQEESKEENSVDGKVTDAGGVPIETEEEIRKSRPQEDLEETFDIKSTEDPMPETREFDYEIPMPRLPGFPPLSEPADWYVPLSLLHPLSIVNRSTRQEQLMRDIPATTEGKSNIPETGEKEGCKKHPACCEKGAVD